MALNWWIKSLEIDYDSIDCIVFLYSCIASNVDSDFFFLNFLTIFLSVDTNMLGVSKVMRRSLWEHG